MKPYGSNLKRLARQLRNEMTDAERSIWLRIRDKQIAGAQFYRQKPLLGFIADFYCPKANLVIELDGSQHQEPSHLQTDELRDQAMANEGLLVLRFDDRQALLETDAVVERILQVVLERMNRLEN
ncbi:endonuclease domain-containing protein [Geomesophilobacter sediminis]|uniref:Endonuclease domain-containing protein n=1 Tax=Geomesophilobacter sediminis TaxID=2798584 RepID=A0A8J7M0S9_9BACT|nr:endonuclease domain-containing protein [Geomesophilobacter sediminis]MBJ6726499.1 endonuclease domain-containing protein [Geomesophilobacter sediminis]